MIQSKNSKIDLVVIAGPTATGKTDLAIKAAKLINGVIINADSVQVYKGLNIGSNKGNLKFTQHWNIEGKTIPAFEMENSGITGLLFDIADPDYSFNVAEYQDIAYKSIDYITQQNKIPILVGGTGLYIDSVIKGYKFEPQELDKTIRAELETYNLTQLVTRIKELSNDTYEGLNHSDKHNPRRLIRLIEKLSDKKLENQNFVRYKHIFLYPDFNKEKLLEKIESRVEQMFEMGLVDEVRDLYRKGYDLKFKSMQSTGYKEVLEMIMQNKYDIESCKEAVKMSHKKYAKRQITWFEGEGRGYNLIKTNNQNLSEIIETSIK